VFGVIVPPVPALGAMANVFIPKLAVIVPGLVIETEVDIELGSVKV
jgi:hypothetical protein